MWNLQIHTASLIMLFSVLYNSGVLVSLGLANPGEVTSPQVSHSIEVVNEDSQGSQW